MGTATFILGLCGAGKTHLANRIVADRKFDENFAVEQVQQSALIEALRSGLKCVVIEIGFCVQSNRDLIVALLHREVPGVRINWICIENDLQRANKNCRERTNKRDPGGHVEINGRISPQYTYPDGAIVMRMWTEGSRD